MRSGQNGLEKSPRQPSDTYRKYEFYQTFKEEMMPILQKFEKADKASITLIAKPDSYYLKKKRNYRSNTPCEHKPTIFNWGGLY
jgi:hypothetical protein